MPAWGAAIARLPARSVVAFAAPLLRPPAGGLLAQARAACCNLYHCAALPLQTRIAACYRCNQSFVCTIHQVLLLMHPLELKLAKTRNRQQGSSAGPKSSSA